MKEVDIEQYLVYDPHYDVSYYLLPPFTEIRCATHNKSFLYRTQLLPGECLCGGHCTEIFCSCNYKAYINVDSARWHPRNADSLC